MGCRPGRPTIGRSQVRLTTDIGVMSAVTSAAHTVQRSGAPNRFRVAATRDSPVAKSRETRAVVRAMMPYLATWQLRGSVECVDHVGGNSAACRHLWAVAARPISDRSALFAVNGCPSATGPSRTPTTATAHPPPLFDPHLQIIA